VSGLKPDPAVLGDPGAPALIGVSGGRDSVALLHWLAKAGFQRLVVCHFDHGWRAESSLDAQFVARLAAGYGLDCVAESSAPGPAREAEGRAARYAFFARVAAARGCGRLFLAHHADDQVETFLFNLLRGAGGPGLGGMQPVTRRTVEGVELELVRPLLACWREEIDAYVAGERLEYRDDRSNADPRYSRNRLRHEVLPALAEAMDRPVRGALWKAAAILAGENEFFAALPKLREIAAELEVATLRALPLALQRRLIHAWLSRAAVGEIGFEEVEAVRRLVEQRVPAKINLAGGRHVRRRSGKLFLT
jgi:tRNA(Ile)-lysidine synthase